MSLNFPFFRFPGFRRNIKKQHWTPSLRIHKPMPFESTTPLPPSSLQHKNSNIDFGNTSETFKSFNDSFSEDRGFFDILGIRLYHDDILLISLIFFLYNEGIDDTGLFVALILLLLN